MLHEDLYFLEKAFFLWVVHDTRQVLRVNYFISLVEVHLRVSERRSRRIRKLADFRSLRQRVHQSRTAPSILLKNQRLIINETIGLVRIDSGVVGGVFGHDRPRILVRG